MLHYHTSYTSYHTDMHKWIGVHTCKQAHTQTHTSVHMQLIAQILLLRSDKQVSSHELSRRCTNTHAHLHFSSVLVVIVHGDKAHVHGDCEKVWQYHAN